MDESILIIIPNLYLWFGDVNLKPANYTSFAHVSTCEWLYVYIYMHQLGKRIDDKESLLNTLLLISCWGVKVKVRHLLEELEATLSNFSTSTLHRQNDIDGHYKVTSMVQGLDQVRAQNLKPPPSADSFARVWICAWLCIWKFKRLGDEEPLCQSMLQSSPHGLSFSKGVSIRLLISCWGVKVRFNIWASGSLFEEKLATLTQPFRCNDIDGHTNYVRTWCRDLTKLELVNLETLTLCFICSCVDSHVAIYYALTGRDLMRRPSLLANRCEDHLLMEYLISAKGIIRF